MATSIENQDLDAEGSKRKATIRMADDPRWFRQKYSRPPSKRLSVGFYESAGILLMLFVLIGSAHPFDFDFSLSLSRFQGLGVAPEWLGVVANLALFVPLGFAAGMQRTQSGQTLGLVFALLVAVSSQLIQIYVASRTPAIWDLASDVGGLLIGFALSRFVDHPTSRIDGRLSIASFLAVAAFLTCQLVPFAPALDVNSLQAAVMNLSSSPTTHLPALLLGALYVFITAGALKAELSSRNAIRILVAVVAVVIVLGPITSATGQSVAIMIGMLIALYPASKLPADRRIFGVLAVLSLSLYFIDGLTPMQLRPQLVFPGLSPFTVLMNNDWLTNLTTLSWKAFVLISAMSLLFGAIGDETFTPMATVVGITILVEGSQIFIASDTPSTLDIVLALVLCAAFRRSVRSNSRYFDGYGRNDRLRREFP